MILVKLADEYRYSSATLLGGREFIKTEARAVPDELEKQVQALVDEGILEIESGGKAAPKRSSSKTSTPDKPDKPPKSGDEGSKTPPPTAPAK